MFKPVIAATAVLAIAGSSIVYAQQRLGGPGAAGGPGGFDHWGARAEHRHRLSAADLQAFTDARIAALKAGLELTPDQTKYWSQFEDALRAVAQLRAQRIEARQARRQQGAAQSGAIPQQGQGPTDPFDRLARRADNLAKTSTALKKLADAGAPLYQSLTDAQKERFTILSRMLRPHPRWRMAFNERRGGSRGDGWRREGWRQDGRGPGRFGPGFGPEHRQFGPDGGDDGGQGSQL